ncbi:MAG: low temperature requirement protein A [Acidimicrobiales bacterium]|nr:low temperature requirement protein A [Acidimicrobiales bacterium]
MRGLVVPDRTEDFTADPVELFFDLAFVFAFSQLVSHLVHHPDWIGLAEAGLLFLLLWLNWSTFTWSANAVSGNSRSTRAFFLVATTAMVPMAASVTSAYDSGGATFAISGSVILLMGITLTMWGLPTGSDEFRLAVKYSYPNLATIVLLIVGGFLEDEARVIIWIVAAAVVIAGTVAAGSGNWIVRPGHFAERHGLIIIIALGEVIVAIGIAVVGSFEDGSGLTTATRLGLVAAGAMAGLLWWSYFDRVLPALEYRNDQLTAGERSRFTRDVYTYGHLPIVAGIIITAAAAEEVLLHPADPTPLAFRAMLAGGLALFLLGIAASVGRAHRVLARERFAASIAIAAIVTIGRSWDGVALLFAVDAVLLVALIFEHVRIEKPTPPAVAT